jgi:hypothetical protein
MYSSFPLTTAGMIALAVQFILPVLVGLVTNARVSAGVKAVLLLALTAVSQFLLGWKGTDSWRELLWNVAIGFTFSVAIHFGLWKPTGVAEKAQRLGAGRNDYR